MNTPENFEKTWVERLASGANVLFRSGAPINDALVHSVIADAFIESLSLKPIGFHWELLDAEASSSEPRSALAEITQALSYDLTNPGKPWMASDTAHQCAQDFLNLFDPAVRTVISNRYDGLWNPIAGGEVEWGFVGFDAQRIALLLMVAK